MSYQDELHELRTLLQQAVELEHSTIPPYLCAWFSLKTGVNDQIGQLIRSVVMEEMLHMALACNILNAVGGAPVINAPGFVPNYPAPLPLGPRGHLIVPLEPFSKDLIKNVFMVIEEPDVTKIPGNQPPQTDGHTIADFYQRITDLIETLGHDAFTGDPSRQVTQWHGPGELFEVTDPASAHRAIHEIVEEGEGASPIDPEDGYDELAHYYKFAEIYYGHRLVNEGGKWTFSGEPIPFDPDGVWPMLANPTLKSYPPGSQLASNAELFAGSYSKLLKGLHRTFNGEPTFLRNAIGSMYAVEVQAKELMRTAIPNDPEGRTAGPPFVLLPSCR